MALTGGKTTTSESVGDGGLEELGGMANPAAMGGEMLRSRPFWGRFASGIEIDKSFRGKGSGESERGRGVSGAAPTQGTTFVTTRDKKEGRDLEEPGAIFTTERAVDDDEVPVEAGALRR